MTRARIINEQGFGHIAFRVDDMEGILNKLLQYGGTKYGELVKIEIENLGTITVIYTRDPEGNIIELQHLITPS